jgi:tetratricopeptide (TPR) repeat protein
VAQGIAQCERALALDRNLADAHANIGLAKYFIGQGSETEAHIEAALRLSPRDMQAFLWMMYAGVAKLWRGADGEAVAWLRRSVEANRSFPLAHFYLAAALAYLGEPGEASAAARAGVELHPSFTISRYRASAVDNEPPGSDGNSGNVATSGKVAMARDGDSEPVTTAMIAASRGTPRGLLGSML